MEYGKSKADLLEKFHIGQCDNAYEFFGCHKIDEGKYVFRVWAPHAKLVWLTIFKGGSEELLPMRSLDDGESFEAVASVNAGTRYGYTIEAFDGRRQIGRAHV